MPTPKKAYAGAIAAGQSRALAYAVQRLREEAKRPATRLPRLATANSSRRDVRHQEDVAGQPTFRGFQPVFQPLFNPRHFRFADAFCVIAVSRPAADRTAATPPPASPPAHRRTAAPGEWSPAMPRIQHSRPPRVPGRVAATGGGGRRPSCPRCGPLRADACRRAARRSRRSTRFRGGRGRRCWPPAGN
jgi:hypothetical protein